MKNLKLSAVAVFLLIFIHTGSAWALFDNHPPMPEAIEALESDEFVDVQQRRIRLNNVIVFKPKQVSYTKGFIIYPGAFVDYRSYAPLAREIAEAGYLVAIPELPMDMALMGFRVARYIHSAYRREVSKWALGGHSLGGTAACMFAVRYRNRYMDGIVLWASYPSLMFSLSRRNIPVISIYGTNDGLTTLGDIEGSRRHLPSDAEFVEIVGGNHTQFGWYDTGDGVQSGDNPADITREQQQDEILQATIYFLDRL